jgi:trigger factor
MPEAPKLLAGKPNWWIRLNGQTLAPGFAEALVGMAIDESRTFDLTLPEDFPFEPLRGKTLGFSATLHEIRERKLPAFDDALAARIEPGKTMEEIRERLRIELAKYAENEFETGKRNGAVQHLLNQVTCELPTHLVNNEMQGILKEIVQENQVRGVSEEELKSQEDEILGFAKQSAADRVRSRFLLLRLAEKENIQVTEQDLALHVSQLSMRYEIPMQKLIKDLQRRNAFGAIREQILVGKALDFIVANVTVLEPAPAPESAA